MHIFTTCYCFKLRIQLEAMAKILVIMSHQPRSLLRTKSKPNQHKGFHTLCNSESHVNKSKVLIVQKLSWNAAVYEYSMQRNALSVAPYICYILLFITITVISVCIPHISSPCKYQINKLAFIIMRQRSLP